MIINMTASPEPDFLIGGGSANFFFRSKQCVIHCPCGAPQNPRKEAELLTEISKAGICGDNS